MFLQILQYVRLRHIDVQLVRIEVRDSIQREHFNPRE
jgi:hypothetical protein